MDETLFQKIYSQFDEEDITRIFNAKKISIAGSKTKKQKVERLITQDDLCKELLTHLDELKGCSIGPLRDSIYRIDENIVENFKDCNAIPSFLSMLYKFDLLDQIPVITATTKFSRKVTTKFDKMEGLIKYPNPTENLTKIKAELSKIIKDENKRRSRHVQIKNITIFEDQNVILLYLLIERGTRHFNQFGFRVDNSNPEDYSLKSVNVHPVDEKMIKVDYGKNESTTTITDGADLALYRKILKQLFNIKKDEKITVAHYLTSKDTENIRHEIEKRMKNTVSTIEKKKPLKEFDKKRLEILKNIEIKEIGFTAKDAPFVGGMGKFTLIADEELRKLIESMGLKEVVDNVFKSARDVDMIIEYNERPITITRHKWEGRNLSEIEKEVIDALIRKQ